MRITGYSSILFLALALSINGQSVDFEVTTVTYGGQYAADGHCFAAWVTDSNDTYVQTLKVAATYPLYMWYLDNFKTHTLDQFNRADAITGATLVAHQAHTLAWDCTAEGGAQVDDGTYKIWVEFTEDNTEGKVASFEVVTGCGDQTYTIDDTEWFTNISLSYTGAAGEVSCGGAGPGTSVNGSSDRSLNNIAPAAPTAERPAEPGLCGNGGMLSAGLLLIVLGCRSKKR